MKRIICLLTALAMSAAVTVNAFAAVTSVSDTRTDVKTLTNNSTMVNKDLGIIDAENGTVLSVSKASPEEYLFKSGEYSYSLLDKDAEGNYFILSADRYGKFSLNNAAVNNIFDPSPADTDSSYSGDSNLAVYLNTDFLNGTSNLGSMTASNSMTTIDPSIKNYIVSHDWRIEGNNQDADASKHLTAATKNDFSVNCKIALLSWSEYIKYSDKIGYASTQYVSNNLTATTTSILRTPNNGSTNLYTVQEKSGNISGSINVTTTSAPTTAYLRPCFYLSRDFFKNTRLDLDSCGSDVKRTLKDDFTEDELLSAGYSAEQIADIKGSSEPELKSGFIMSDDMENGTSNWQKKGLTSDSVSAEAVAYPEGSTDNMAMAIACNTYAYLKLNEDAERGILTVEADIEINGGNFGVGIVESGNQNMQGKLYPVYIGNGNTKLSAIINRNAGSYDVTDSTIASYYLDDEGANIKISNETQFHLKLIIDASSGKCAVMVNGNLSDTTDIPYLGTSKGQKAIGAVAFMNRKTGNTAYVDNVKISYDPEGSVVSELVSGNGKTAFTMREGIDASAITSEDIIIKDSKGNELTVSSAIIDGNAVIAETSETMSEGKMYILSVPSLSGEYPVTDLCFKCSAGSFAASAAITDEKYAAGETASAVCTVLNSAFASKKVVFYLAAFKGDCMTDVTVKEIDISENNFGETTEAAELRLSEEADCIRAFIWDENQIPYNQHDEKTKTN